MTAVDDLCRFLTVSPSPYHAAAEAVRRLEDAGFRRLERTDAWPSGAGAHFVTSGGTLVAWLVGREAANRPVAPFHLVGAHTDSPNLRIKPRPDQGAHGWRQLGVEVYGGALWNSWLDRDLGLSGRVWVGGESEPVLVHVDRPLLRIPQLAIHLDREANAGLRLDPQRHLNPVWGAGEVEDGAFRAFLAKELAEEHGLPTEIGDDHPIRAWDLMLHDLTPPTRLGANRDLLAGARLDNLVSCWAGVQALKTVAGMADAPDAVPVLCLYDHEEVGSQSATGADGVFLSQVLERIVLSRGGSRDDHLRALAGSWGISADGAHATHPNYPERHDPQHPVRIDGGPVIKVNANQRYASEAPTIARLTEALDQANVPYQWFVSRNDQPCGSTIGPISAARLGIPTVDLGVAQLSMHSARELCGATDPLRLAGTLFNALIQDAEASPSTGGSSTRPTPTAQPGTDTPDAPTSNPEPSTGPDLDDGGDEGGHDEPDAEGTGS